MAGRLDGVGSGHWWTRFLDIERDPTVMSPTSADMVLGPVEIMIQVVRAAAPKRLD